MGTPLCAYRPPQRGTDKADKGVSVGNNAAIGCDAMRILALAIVLGAAVSAAADHKLSGVVTDPKGAAIAEATVEVFEPGARLEARTKTDSSGKFTTQALPSGTYVVRVAKSGFEPQQQPVTLSDKDGFFSVALPLAKQHIRLRWTAERRDGHGIRRTPGCLYHGPEDIRRSARERWRHPVGS